MQKTLGFVPHTFQSFPPPQLPLVGEPDQEETSNSVLNNSLGELGQRLVDLRPEWWYWNTLQSLVRLIMKKTPDNKERYMYMYIFPYRVISPIILLYVFKYVVSLTRQILVCNILCSRVWCVRCVANTLVHNVLAVCLKLYCVYTPVIMLMDPYVHGNSKWSLTTLS